MLHKTLAATTTPTDQELGQFTAIVSAWEADREKDVIAPDAFRQTIQAWQRSGKNLPLLFEHSTTTVGFIDPQSMHPTKQGLVVAGRVDRETEKGQQVWRTIKAGSAGFSIGFAAESRPRKGGGRTLTSIDLLEISVTSRPMHPATRALSWKAADPDREAVRQEFEDAMTRLITPTPTGPPSDADLRKREAALGLKAARPITITSFQC
jgi:HK97 family phage prohead protease